MPLSALSALGVGIEASWGTGVDPQICIPLEPYNISFVFENILDQSLRGELASDFGVYQGVYRVEGDISGHVFPDEIGYLLSAFFGAPSSVGTQAPYEHTFTVEEVPYSLSITDDVSGIELYRYEGVRVSEFGFSFSAAENLLDFTATLVGRSYSTASSTSVPTSTATGAFAGWRATVTKGTDTTYAKLIEMDVNMSREITLVYTAQNTQLPHTMFVGPLEVTGTATLSFTEAADLEDYLNNVSEAFVVDFQHGTGTSLREFKFTASDLSYGNEPPDIDRSGVDVRLVMNWRALHNTTDAGPCQIYLKNAVASYTSA